MYNTCGLSLKPNNTPYTQKFDYSKILTLKQSLGDSGGALEM